jgi:hypothetical protein
MHKESPLNFEKKKNWVSLSFSSYNFFSFLLSKRTVQQKKGLQVGETLSLSLSLSLLLFPCFGIFLLYSLFTSMLHCISVISKTAFS